MNELRTLVQRYAVANEIDYPAFRSAMVERFQSKRNPNPLLQKTVEMIGDECFDFSEGLIEETQLQQNLLGLIGTTVVLCDPLTLGNSFYSSCESGASSTRRVGRAAAASLAWIRVEHETEFA